MESYDPQADIAKRHESIDLGYSNLGFNKTLSKLKYLLVKNNKNKSAENIIEAIKSDIQYLKQQSKNPVPPAEEIKAPQPQSEVVEPEPELKVPEPQPEPEPMPKKEPVAEPSKPEPEPVEAPAKEVKPKEKSKACKRGSKEEVYNGLADKTSGGLCKGDLCVNDRGKIVSKKKHDLGKQNFKGFSKKGKSSEQ